MNLLSCVMQILIITVLVERNLSNNKTFAVKPV